jgi:hypothetical protein
VHLTIAGTGVYLNTSLGGRVAHRLTGGDGGRDVSANIHDGTLYWKLWAGENDPSGSLSVNPLDYLYGGCRRYSYEDVAGPRIVLLVTTEGTEHSVELTLQRQTLARPRGPREQSWTVAWDCKDGIPVRDDGWKGDCFYGSAVHVDSDEAWVTAALDALRADVTRDREHYQWRPRETSDT